MVKFLIVRFSSIGDIILTTPVIRALKTQVEDAEIHYLTKKKYQTLLNSNPYIGKVHTLDHNFSRLTKILKREKYDYIIDLHRNIRSARLKLTLSVLSFSFKKLNLLKWLLVNFKINKLPQIHIVDRYLETVRWFSVKNDNQGLDYFIPSEEEIDPRKLINCDPEDYIVLVVGGGHYTKQIPGDHLVEIIEKLKSKLVLLGGPEDESKSDYILSRISKNSKVFNLVGKLSINQSASLIKQCKLIVTPDTGMMHIASAFKRRIFSVWGNTVPIFGMSPYMASGDSVVFEVTGLACRPCSKIGYKNCPKKHFYCMEKQDYNNLIRKINSL